MTDEAEVLID